MQLLENSKVDLWWDEIRPRLKHCETESHDFAHPAVLKASILNGSLLCFADENAVVFGHFVYEDTKTFYWSYMEGKEFYRSSESFLSLLRERFACRAFYSCALPINHRLYRMQGHKLGWEVQRRGHNFSLDLFKFKFNEKLAPRPIELRRNDELDNWFHLLTYCQNLNSTDLGLLRSKVSNNITTCYIVNGMMLLGQFVLLTNRREFKILAILGNNIGSNLQYFMRYLLDAENCRFLTVDCEARPAAILLKKLSGKDGVTIREFFKFVF